MLKLPRNLRHLAELGVQLLVFTRSPRMPPWYFQAPHEAWRVFAELSHSVAFRVTRCACRYEGVRAVRSSWCSCPWSSCIEPRQTLESLRTQRILFRRLILTHPHPESFKRAEKVRQERSDDVARLNGRDLDALYRGRMLKLSQLHSLAVDAGQSATSAQRSPLWEDMLDVLCELDVLAWAFSSLLENST